MSDLDADLYGDLYGDENEFAVPTEEPKEESKPQEQEPEKTTAPATPQTATVTPAPETVKSPPPAATPEEKEGSPIPSLANGNVPQPIQSYQSSTQDYPSRVDYGFRTQPQRESTPLSIPSLPIAERHVRPSEMKEEGKMFIGGLNWDTTDEGLRKYFEQFGKVEACTIMRDATGRSRCFAFLTFEDPASVNAVMVREHLLDGKIIDPKRAIPRQEHQRAQKLFIGGLAGTVTSDSMREFFSQYGKVIDSTVMVDRETGRSKGFGFVSFENTNVEPLLGFGKLEIDGKMIDVKLAQPRHQREQNDGGYRSSGAYSASGGQSDSSYGTASGGGYSGAAQGVQSTTTTASMGGAAGGTPFDPQALAQLYTRMFQQFGGAAGMGGMSGMGMMGAGMGAAGMGGMGGMSGMGMGGAGAAGGMGRMGGGMGMGMSGGGMSPMGGRGGMGGGMSAGGGGMIGGPINAPRGPRGGSSGPQGVGPQRTQRGHSYHPYSR